MSVDADFFAFEKAKATGPSEELPFTRKQNLWIADVGGGNGYPSNQIRFDLSQMLSSTQNMVDLSSATLEIPLVQILSGLPATKLSGCDYAATLKAGWHNIIQSINVVWDGQTINAPIANSQWVSHFKLLSTMCVNDVTTKADTNLMHLDTVDSWTSTEDGAGAGGGNIAGGNPMCIVNNFASPPYNDVARDTNSGSSYNRGLLQRMKRLNYNNAAAGKSQVLTPAQVSDMNKSGYIRYTAFGTTPVGVATTYMIATIRLADICDFFKQLPLCVAPSSGCQLLINLHQGYSTFACAAARAAATYTGRLTQASSSFPYDVCPVMMTQPYPCTLAANARTGDFSLANRYTWELPDTATANLQLGLYAVRPTSGPQAGMAAHPQTMCRLYYSSVTLSPSYGLSLLESPNKVVEYEQYQYVSFNGFAPNASIQRIILSSVTNCKGVLIIPFQDATCFANTLGAPLQAFCAEPGLPSPCGYLTNFNITVGGSPVYPEVKGLWETQVWLDELSQLGINGGAELGVGSSLISQSMFENGLRYYWINLERCFTDSRIPQSIAMVGNNGSNMTLALHCFVITKQSVMINIATGKVVTGTA